MGKGSVSSAFLVILNIAYVVLGLGLTAASIWLFIEVNKITGLRNNNHYILDYHLYWPQSVPWMFMVTGFFILFVTGCGFVGAKKKSRGMMLVYITFQSISILLLLIAAILTLVLADTASSDAFFHDTIWDGFKNMNEDKSVQDAFGVMERRFQCCGAGDARDYKGDIKLYSFPASCCDTYYGHGWQEQYPIDCDFTNKLANERLGCAKVASIYARISFKVLSAIAIFSSFIGILNLVFAISLFKNLNNKSRAPPMVVQYEQDSKKVLL